MKRGTNNLHEVIQNSIFEAIGHQEFNAALPPLSDETWSTLLIPSKSRHEQNERLEFLGDALMYATIGRLLFTQIPDGTPFLYTCIRAALHSNRTFSRLAEKLDILAVSDAVLKALTMRTFGEGTLSRAKNKPEIKATADLFETVIAAYYVDRGFEALCEWVSDIYTPLIRAASTAFRASRDRPAPKEPTHERPGRRPQRIPAPPDVPPSDVLHAPLPTRSQLLVPAAPQPLPTRFGPGSSKQVTVIDLCRSSPDPAEDKLPRMPLKSVARKFYDLTNEPDSEDESNTRRVRRTDEVHRTSLSRGGALGGDSSNNTRGKHRRTERQFSDHDDDDSLYAVEISARHDTLRGAWERRNQPNPVVEISDSSGDEDERELERMLVANCDPDSDTAVADMDVDVSDDDADLYRPSGSRPVGRPHTVAHHTGRYWQTSVRQ
ncbi:hypothetical protein CERSUDRAFT_110683 [Gelatoporia subvermispora B]|uniref:RNase III domain-containing protein n=1 Tax=Ceriporiopsis subvermispora (strain B) TaxID=914234 RepID=M2QYB4_CERS8|nr:hypothetical protein CERSUDRAFT_110683 [Gelatoporia subvermispora B]